MNNIFYFDNACSLNTTGFIFESNWFQIYRSVTFSNDVNWINPDIQMCSKYLQYLLNFCNMLVPYLEHLPFYFVPSTALGTGDSKMNEQRIFFLRVLIDTISNLVDILIKVCSECREGCSITGVGERCQERLSREILIQVYQEIQKKHKILF